MLYSMRIAAFRVVFSATKPKDRESRHRMRLRLRRLRGQKMKARMNISNYLTYISKCFNLQFTIFHIFRFFFRDSVRNHLHLRGVIGQLNKGNHKTCSGQGHSSGWRPCGPQALFPEAAAALAFDTFYVSPPHTTTRLRVGFTCTRCNRSGPGSPLKAYPWLGSRAQRPFD